MSDTKIPQSWLICHNQQEWHDWLTFHHESESEVWLQIRKARSIKSGISLNEAVEEALCFGWIDSKMYSLDSDKYILRFTPRKHGSVWSLINRKRAETLMAEERMTKAGMVTIREAQASGSWQNAYSSKVKTDVPVDLIEALQKDPLASSNFEKWSNSQKLQAVSWIEKSRQPKTRANRINRVVNCARNGQKLF